MIDGEILPIDIMELPDGFSVWLIHEPKWTGIGTTPISAMQDLSNVLATARQRKASFQRFAIRRMFSYEELQNVQNI